MNSRIVERGTVAADSSVHPSPMTQSSHSANDCASTLPMDQGSTVAQL